MRRDFAEQVPHELRPIVERLRAEREQGDALQLDAIKQRVLSRHTPARGTLRQLRSRIAGVLTVLALAAGSGGAFALAGGTGAGSGQEGAAFAQYCPPKAHGKGCRKHHKHHKHTKSHQRHHKSDSRHKGYGRGEVHNHHGRRH